MKKSEIRGALFALAAASLGAISAQAQITPTPVCEAQPVAEELFGQRFGALTFRGGLHLSPATIEFGGVSGLDVQLAAPMGDALLAVSDRGYAVNINTTVTDGRLVAAQCTQQPLIDVDGAPVGGRRRDSEGVALFGAGAFAVSFERRHRVDLFASADEPAREGPAIGESERLVNNRALEALTILPNGDLLAGSESPSLFARPHPVWRFAPTGDSARPFEAADAPAFSIAARRGYGLTGMDATPGGDLVVLERYWSATSGNRIAIGLLSAAQVQNAGPRALRPQLLFHWARGDALPIDNFEGLAVSRNVDGVLRLWLVSDDNLNTTDQRTLLYLFEMVPPVSD